MNLGDQLKKHRNDRGLTLREMALIVGVTATWLSRLENHYENTMSDETAHRVAEIFHLDRRELFRALGRFPKDTMAFMAENKALYDHIWETTEK
jgi:transcriptional regulator with XRE-family HTH domain